MKKIDLLCNAHLDPVWLWEWEEGAAEAISTFRMAAELCEQYDNFIFNHNEALLYRWVEEFEPELFARIQHLVQEGKWHIMGGWYLQPDCNMPSGESFVRQILMGRRYFSEKFNVQPTTAINFDPFGHTRGLVQIMAKSGYDSYIFCRPAQQDCPLPGNDFVWIGYDGSKIIGHRTMSWYNAPLGKARDKVEKWMADNPDRVLSLVLWGVGNHGGGPSRGDVYALEALIEETAAFEISHATPEMYFAHLRETGATLPEHLGDINPWAVGCYTSQVQIKQRHRELENTYYAIEKMAATAALYDLVSYPKIELDAALADLLMAEFHDILPGSSIQPVEATSLRLMDHGLEILSRLKARTFFVLAQDQPKAAEGKIPILVYNPHPFSIDTIVACEFQLADQNWEDAFTQVTVEHDGIALPTQVEQTLGNINLDWRKRIFFKAELKPSQMNRFDCVLSVLPAKPEVNLHGDGGMIRFKTDDLDVLVNTSTGLLDRYRVRGVDFFQPGALRPLVMRDNEDPWGMQTRAFRDLAGVFALMQPDEGTAFSGIHTGELPSVRIIEDGPVRTVIEAVLVYGKSAICQRYFLPKSGTEFEVEVRVHWNEKDSMLKFSVPTTFSQARYLGQVAYGVGELPTNGDEVVAQKWVAVVSEHKGGTLTCINDGIYGSDFLGGKLRLTLLRSPAYSGHPIHNRPIVPQDRYTPRIDQGERVFHFWINAGQTTERLTAVDREALVHNERPYALSFFPHGGGENPPVGLELRDHVIQVTAFKQAEDGKGYIIRMFEPTGRPRSTTLIIHGLEMEVELGFEPFEVKTLYLDPVEKLLSETDLMENMLKHLEI
jgi:alpha-mannosidase